MRLSRRIVLLILISLLPMVAAGIFTLASLYQQRRNQLGELAMQQAQLVQADLQHVIGGVRGLLLAVGQIPPGPDCSDRLATLVEDLPSQRFVAVLDGAGRVLCSSQTGFAETPAAHPGWLAPLLEGDGLRVGTYATLGNRDHPFLPIVEHRRTADRDYVLVSALDLTWLNAQLARLGGTDTSLLAHSAIGIVDRDGIILARHPDPETWVGQRVSVDMYALIGASKPGSATLEARDGKTRLVAYLPSTYSPTGLFVAVGLYPPDLLGAIQTAVLRGAALGGLAALLAIAVTWSAARRFIQRPAARLLEAVQLWQQGALSTRVEVGSDHSEFGRLGQAFNTMATILARREAEQTQQAQLLEARVAERTRELSESNNRLQVEIAERERAEVVLQQAQKLQAVGQLAGGIAHDFNNLLATILGSLELIERRVPAGDERLPTLLTRAMDAVQRGAQLTSRLLAFSRRQRLAARPTDVNRLVTDLVTLASSTLGRRVRIETDLASDLWPALVDPSQVEASVLNLALNARDAMPQGGVLTFTTGNEVVPPGTADAEPGEYVRIGVTDTGVGMAPDVLARAFEPFFTTKELGQGSGLGLSQVYGLARQSGGTVRLRSQPGEGTTVELLLPRAAPQPGAGTDRPVLSAPRRQSPGTVVLLVDDDADVRQVGVEMLRDLGYQVVEAAGGKEALDRVRHLASPPALLVLDYAMPGMNGLRLAAALRALGINAPLLLATGYAELSDDQSGVTPDAILHKPFSLAALDRTLTGLRARIPETA